MSTNIDEFTTYSQQDEHYIAYEMIDSDTGNGSKCDDLLGSGEQILELADKEKGYQKLHGIET